MGMHLKFLTVIDNEAVRNEDINESVKVLVKRITKEIRECTSTRKDSDLVFILPQSTLLFPKQYLKEHIETKWEKFAKSKGIKKKKGSLVYDEEIGEYIPRYGPYSKKNRILNAAVRDGEITSSALRRKKKKNIEKNRASMLANRAKNN